MTIEEANAAAAATGTGTGQCHIANTTLLAAVVDTTLPPTILVAIHPSDRRQVGFAGKTEWCLESGSLLTPTKVA